MKPAIFRPLATGIALAAAAFMIALAPAALPQTPVLGVASERKADWIREWIGAGPTNTVSWREARSRISALELRNLLPCVKAFPLNTMIEDRTAHNPLLWHGWHLSFSEVLDWIAAEGKRDMAGLVEDIRGIAREIPGGCVEAVQGRLTQATNVADSALGPIRQIIRPDDPIGLLIEEPPRLQVRDRNRWDIPFYFGLNLRARDMLQYGDTWEVQYMDREEMREYKLRAVVPTITAKEPDIGMDGGATRLSGTSRLLWRDTPIDSADILDENAFASVRYYPANNGNFLSIGYMVRRISLEDRDFVGPEWASESGYYNALAIAYHWRFNPLDYDPDILLAPGTGANLGLKVSSKLLGSRANYQQLQAVVYTSREVSDRMYWDIKVKAELFHGLPAILLPSVGGSDTVHGFSSYVSADRLAAVQQQLRRHFQWRHGIVFIPFVLFDTGWASLEDIDGSRHQAVLAGIGVGVRWEMTRMFAFKMLEITCSQGIGAGGVFNVDVGTRFDF